MGGSSLEAASRSVLADFETVGNGAMTPDAALRKVQKFLVDQLRDKPVRVYEAGGGSLSILPLAEFDKLEITAVDIDEVQLRNNRYAHKRVLADIQTHVFPPDSFELIVCHNVIEHLDSLDQAIRRFHHALAPGGLLFIGAPNPASLFGLVTKYTPHWFHVWFYRAILRQKDAGKPGMHPFRTVYHPIVSPKALLSFCEDVGFKPAYFNLYMGKNFVSLKETRPMLGRLLGAGVGLMNTVTFGKLKLEHGDYHAVFRKPLEPVAPGAVQKAG